MNTGRTIFSQLMNFLPTHEFRSCVERYNGNYKVKSFSCWDQYLCMAFAQLTYRESLRDIQACLRSANQKLYHMGIRGKVSRNTLAHANQVRDWRIYADFANVLIGKARALYAGDAFGLELAQTVYALDATTIDLCLSLFPWATFRQRKGAVKLHTLLDLRGNIPTIAVITPGTVHEVNILDEIPFEGCDQIVSLHGFYANKDYPEKLRRIRFYDRDQNRRLVFLTNNATLPALTIARLYKCRWQI